MTERTVISSRMTDEEALLVRLAESIDRPGLDATSTLTLVASWLRSEFAEGDFSDEASQRFRSKLARHKVDVEKLRVVIDSPERFPHRNERSERRDPHVVKEMGWVRATVSRLLAGEAKGHGGVREQDGSTVLLNTNTSVGIERRLNRDDPELAARVAAREITPHAAAIQAGIRKPRVSVQINSPQRIAEQLRKYLSAEQIAQLIKLLLTEEM